MNFIIFLVSPTFAIPLINMAASSLHKRDDYSFQYFSDEPRINLSSTDPDINPIFLAFLLSLMILVLLLCLFIANKLLEIEREKEYEPNNSINIPSLGISPTDVKQNGLWTVNGLSKDLEEIVSKPEPVKDPKVDEYNRLKEQLESVPDNYLDRVSFYSTSTTQYATHAAESESYGSLRAPTDKSRYSASSYGTVHESNTKKTMRSKEPNLTAANLDTTIEYSMNTMDSQESANMSVNDRDSMDSYSFTKPKKNSRKSVIPSARMSTFSVMTSDSLL